MVKIFIVLFFSCLAHAVSVSVRVSKDHVRPQERFSLILTILSEKQVLVENLNLPEDLAPIEVEDFHQSTQFQSFFSSPGLSPGGRRSEVKTLFNWDLSSQKEGRWKINPIDLVVDGKAHLTKPLFVTVSKKAPSTKPPSKRKPVPDPFDPPGSLFPDAFDLFKDSPFLQPPPDLSDKDLFLRIKAPSRRVYLGEMMITEWNLYRKQGLPFALHIETLDFVQPEGFWIEKIKDQGRLHFDQTEKIKGEVYLKAVISSQALFPLKTGTLSIQPLEVKVQSQDHAFHFFSNRKKRGRRLMKLKSPPVSIEVIPLPKPKTKGFFTGAVGQFVIDSAHTPAGLSEGDLLSYKVRFEGQGNIRMIELPPWPKESDFTVYDVLESENFSVEKASREYEILLSAKKTGSLKIPKMIWTTFDPALKSYVSHELPEHLVQVKAGLGSAASKSQRFFKGPLKALRGQEPAVLNPEGAEPAKESSIKTSLLTFYKKYQWILWGFVLFLSFLWMSQKIFFQKKKNGARLVKKSLMKARAQKEKGNHREAGLILIHLMDEVLAGAAGTSGRDRDEILKQAPPSLRTQYGQEIRELTQRLEQISFAEESPDPEQIEKAAAQCEKLLPQLLSFQPKGG